MVTKKTEPAPETESPSEQEPETKTEDKTSLREEIKAVLEEMGTKKPEPEEGKPVTSREEEQRTYSIVREAIETFKEELGIGKEPEKKEEKKETETVPASNPVRWIERKLWGKE